MTALTDPTRERILARLRRLYGDAAESTMQRIAALAEAFDAADRSREELWTERDVVLITYGDQVQSDEAPPLAELQSFLLEYGLNDVINSVHILPFSPYSSDDGFSVIDYRKVNPDFGTWDHVAAIGESFDLMFDLVLNHCSSRHEWFQKYLAGEEPYTGYFIDLPPETDVSQVTRPRSTPLLTAYETNRGTKHVWTTFSADQVDLNFGNSNVLIEMLDVLLSYVQRGARIIRLDAIAYLWKQLGTSCIHLPETHEVVKLMRDLLDALAPGTILLTETNVPHAENVSYFGEGDEAHMVYQFSLAPLLLDAFLARDVTPLRTWLNGLEPLPPTNAFFNFTASHDGIGVRPLEGLIDEERFERLIDATRHRGGLVNTRRQPDGTDSPYELNITYYSALADPDADDDRNIQRFLASQAVMLSLAGIPGIYFHSLFGTPNDRAGVERTGHARTINRRKFQRAELDAALRDESSVARRVFDGYRHLLRARIAQPAFHPNAPQRVIETGDDRVLSFVRGEESGPRILVVVNVSDEPVKIAPPSDFAQAACVDLLTGDTFEAGGPIQLPPARVRWLQ